MGTPSGYDSGLGPVITVTDGQSTPATSTAADRHRDATYPPRVTPLIAGVAVIFDTAAPNTDYKPIDAAIKLQITISANVGPNIPIVRVDFGSEYLDKANKTLPPIVLVSEETYPSSQIWRVAALNHLGCTLVSEFGLTAPVTIRLRCVVVNAAAN